MNKKYTGIFVLVLIVLGVAYFTSRTPTTGTLPITTITEPTSDQTAPAGGVLYSCNAGKTITAVYHEGETLPAAASDQPPLPGGTVDVKLSDGRSMTLQQTISADGARYANTDESFVFWNKGNGVLVLENNVEKSYIGCISVAPAPTGEKLSQIYSSGTAGFSLRYPTGYTVDESYKYQELGPNKTISGVKFTIPASLTTGTNLSNDSYLAVEEIPQSQKCDATLFLDQGAKATSVTEANTTYSLASSTGAGAGNRYEETVYALPGTNPCVAIRYLIHYGVIENYPTGTVAEFDKQALLAQFDAIRKTLVVTQ